MKYTPIVDDFQISDVAYLDGHVDEHPRKFDIVKYYNTEPTEVYVVETDQKEIKDRFCYTVAWLEWDSHESCFDFNSWGLRWLECAPTERVIQMILKFAEMMTYVVRGWEEKENA